MASSTWATLSREHRQRQASVEQVRCAGLGGAGEGGAERTAAKARAHLVERGRAAMGKALDQHPGHRAGTGAVGRLELQGQRGADLIGPLEVALQVQGEIDLQKVDARAHRFRARRKADHGEEAAVAQERPPAVRALLAQDAQPGLADQAADRAVHGGVHEQAARRTVALDLHVHVLARAAELRRGEQRGGGESLGQQRRRRGLGAVALRRGAA